MTLAKYAQSAFDRICNPEPRGADKLILDNLLAERQRIDQAIANLLNAERLRVLRKYTVEVRDNKRGLF